MTCFILVVMMLLGLSMAVHQTTLTTLTTSLSKQSLGAESLGGGSSSLIGATRAGELDADENLRKKKLELLGSMCFFLWRAHGCRAYLDDGRASPPMTAHSPQVAKFIESDDAEVRKAARETLAKMKSPPPSLIQDVEDA